MNFLNTAIVQLPPPLLHHVIAKPEWFGAALASLWFRDNEDKSVCMRALGLADSRQVLLQSGDYQLAMHIFIGTTGLARLPGDIPRIFYLSPRMFSDKDFARPESFADIDNYSFCLLNKFELAHYDGESSLLDDFYSDAKRIFRTTPFLGRNTAEDYPSLKQWLAQLVLLINVQQLKNLSARRLVTALTYTSQLLSFLPPSGRIEQTEQLLALLALRQHGLLLSQYINQVTATKEQGEEIFEPLSHELDAVANEHGDKTYQYVYNEPFKPTLGNEVLPALRKAKQELRAFAKKLEQWPEPLQIIGMEISGLLEAKTPILALTGTYSSGKTTLLNSLLIGQDQEKIRAFRTKQGANTAIVSEIAHVGAGKTNQRVVFEYRERIKDFPLAAITPADTDIAKEYISEILTLLEKGVLTNPNLRIMPINSQLEAKGTIELDSIREIQQCLQYLLRLSHTKQREDRASEHNEASVREASGTGDSREEGIYTLSANVAAGILAKEYLRTAREQQNPEGSTQYRLPKEIDLTTDEGWEDFQGRLDGPQVSQKGGRIIRGQNIRHWTERAIATLLIERSRIYLNHNLLELTTIADTPGTESANSGHDHVTKGYLQDASAYMLLLPTNLDASKRTNNGILKQLVLDLHGDLHRIAFVVNCWPVTDENTNIEDKISHYIQILCNAFGLSQNQWHALQNDPARRNFFVIQLKGIQQGERPDILHNYPSLVPLQAWVEKTFRSDRYRARYDKLLELLDDGWRQKYQVSVKKLRDLYEEAEKIQRLCQNLRRFIRDLEDITDNRLNEVRSFRERFTAQGRQVTRMMRERGAEPKNIKIPEDLNNWRNILRDEYTELNDLLGDLANLRTLEKWIEEVKGKARPLPITLPALVPLDPADQPREWSNNRSFSPYEVDAKFADVIEKWPKTLWQKFLGIFKDSRIILVEGLQEFWKDQYAEIWSRRLETYLQRCEAFLEEQQQAVQEVVKEAIEELESRNDPERRKQLEQKYRREISAFEALEQERQQLQAKLAQALA